MARAASRTVMGLQQHCAERRGKRERVDCREEHGYGDGDGELTKQLAGNAGDERHRDEHRQQYQRDRDDGRGNLRHGALRRGGGG